MIINELDHKINIPQSSMLQLLEANVKIPVTKKQWNHLSQNIAASFDGEDSTGAWQYVADGYGSNDKFYKAHGEYGYYYTCNSWTNEMLKKSGMYARKHALFSEEIINLYK